MPRAKVEIPKRIARVLSRCRDGGYVIKSMPSIQHGEAVPRWTFDDGSDAPEISVSQAIQRGLLVPGGDGLFAGEFSQTYRSAE